MWSFIELSKQFTFATYPNVTAHLLDVTDNVYQNKHLLFVSGDNHSHRFKPLFPSIAHHVSQKLNLVFTQIRMCIFQISQFDASPRQPCNNGYYPIHEAAKNASSKTLEAFLQWGESRGCSREQMIEFCDSEGNVPLHSAVHGGDIRAVEICIK